MPKGVKNGEPFCFKAFNYHKPIIFANFSGSLCIRIVRVGISANALDVRIRFMTQGGSA